MPFGSVLFEAMRGFVEAMREKRPLFLPVHLLGLAPLLGGISPVAGDVKLEDDGVVHHPVDGRGGGHGVGEDAFPLGEDQV